MSVVLIGDANVDLEIVLPQHAKGGVHANSDPRRFGGGSAANTAAMLAGLGVSCSFVGTVGDDDHGRFATESLAAAGVDTSLIEVTTDLPTGMVMIVVPPDGERLIYVWPPSGGAHRALRTEVAVDSLTGADWLHVSGLCLRVSPAREAILAAMAHARDTSVAVSFDLNLRLENWGWDDDFREVVESAVSLSDVVLGAAVDEIAPLVGIEDPVRAATALAGDHRLVIARLGADGAVACSSAGAEAVDGFEVEVVDTAGAGDAFNAGFIAARLANADVVEAVRWGNAVAALSVSQPGARGAVTHVDAESLLTRAGDM